MILKILPLTIDHKKAYKVLVDGGEEFYLKVREILDKAVIQDEQKDITISKLKTLMTEQQANDLYEAEFDGTGFLNAKK